MKTKKINFDYKYGFSVKNKNIFTAEKGISEEKVRMISHMKGEPKWMLEKRVQAFQFFSKEKLPEWGADLSSIQFDDITYFIRSIDKQVNSWDELPTEIKDTYDRIGVPEAKKSSYLE